MELVHEILQPLADFLVLISNKDVDQKQLWYLSPTQHAAELLFFNITFGLGLYFTIKNASKNFQGDFMVDSKQQLSPMLKIFRIVLTCCYLITIVHKFNGGKRSYVLMPCHVATLFYLYCLYTPSHRNAQIAFNISTHFQFYTWLALALPDHRTLIQFGEIPNFWVHHWVLCILPLYLIVTNHYHLDNSEHFYFKLALFIGGLIHFDIMGIAGIISGLNVGYMIHPPPATPFQGMWFRWGHAAFLIIMGWFCGYILPYILRSLAGLVGFNYHLQEPTTVKKEKTLKAN